MAEGEGPRIKFAYCRKGSLCEFLAHHVECENSFAAAAEQLSRALRTLELAGAAPVLQDSKVGGNGAVRITGQTYDFFVVSKSGKKVGEVLDPFEDMCIITCFNPDNWSIEFYSKSEAILPTSDTPLHYFSLSPYKDFGWTAIPYASLHGHALETEKSTRSLNIPHSPTLTLFSTREDSEALMTLLSQNPYPNHKIFIRTGHGFIILGSNIKDALTTFTVNVQPYI